MWGQPPSAVRGAKLRRRDSVLVGRHERVHKRFRPQPWIVRPSGNQASPNGIIQQVLDLGIQALRRSHDMVNRFRLPQSPLPAESLVDSVSRYSFDRIHDFRQGADFHSVVVGQRGKDQVNMIRHRNRHPKVELLSVVMQAGLDNDGTGVFWKCQAMVCAKCHKMRFLIDLKMRKLPSGKKPVASSLLMWGQPSPAVLRSEAPLALC